MSTKKLHREIMLSSVYQLGNDNSEVNYAKDSANRLYWRANRRRMDVEQIRDSLLAASGALEKKMGGPSEALTPQSTRRTLYGKVSRYKLDDFLQLFDFPSPNISAERRYSTNVPLQRLFFMNSDFVQQQAELVASRVEAEPTSEGRIRKIYRIVFGRAATPEEVKLGLDYLRTEPLKEYEERKKAEEEKEKKKAEEERLKAEKQKTEKKEMTGKPGEPAPAAAPSLAPPPAAAPPTNPSPDMPDPNAMDPGGMMAGVVPGADKGEAAKPLLPVTHWGRYVKILLTSTEFIFIK
jgi:hypothetical protein